MSAGVQLAAIQSKVQRRCTG